MPKKFKLGKSLGTIFKVLEKAIHGHVEEKEIFYIPFNFTIPCAPLKIMTRSKERAIKMRAYMKMMEYLEEMD